MTQSKEQQKLEPVRKAMGELHRLLLAMLKKERERVHGAFLNPAEWFQILLAAPEYQWLKALNSLLSDLDALVDSNKATVQDLVILRFELERLFFKEDGDVTSFNSHYRKLFAHDHDVILTHGRLKDAFSELPEGKPPFNAEEVRRGWHNIGASKRKLLN